MSKVIFQIMAGLVFLSAALLLLGGIVYLRKWAALAASVMALYVATSEIRAALHPIPGCASWLGFLFAILLIVPSVLTGVYWRTLLWHNRQIRTPGP